MGEVTQAIALLQSKLLVNQGESTSSRSSLQSSSLVNQGELPVEQDESLIEKSTSQGRQQLDQSLASGVEWNVYLHHPRGTVERIAGSFPDEEQAESEMSSQMAFGLFPEAKGYRWKCREETQGTGVNEQQTSVPKLSGKVSHSSLSSESGWSLPYGISGLDNPDDEPDEILYDFLEPEPVVSQQKSSSPEGTADSQSSAVGWLTVGEAYELAVKRGYKSSKSAFRKMAAPHNPEKTPSEKLFAEWGFEVGLGRRGGSGQTNRWLRSLPGWE